MGLNQKSKIGKSRLVKESFLNTINEEPVKTEKIKEVKEPKEKPIKPMKPIKEEPVNGKVGRPKTRDMEAIRKEKERKKEEREKLKIEARAVAYQLKLQKRREERAQNPGVVGRPKREIIEPISRANKNDVVVEKPFRLEKPRVEDLDMTF